jgi:hypothetical protein
MGRKKLDQKLNNVERLSPLTGLNLFWLSCPVPLAHARGYILSPLRGFGIIFEAFL